MRVTVKGVLLGGSVGVLITTVFLWTQCKPPLELIGPKAAYSTLKMNQHQKRRQPLMMNHQLGNFDGTEDYTDDLTGALEPKSNLIGDDSHVSQFDEELEEKNEELLVMDISCIINRETKISCRRDETDVFIPFSFIHNYFEVYGRIIRNEQGQEVFEWSHSYSNVYEPQDVYNPVGQFLNFHLFNVEARDRVKCISAAEGVPISTQWQSSGYTYPIQIAQYGLSHYSKHLEDEVPQRVIFEDGFKKKGKWKQSSRATSLTRIFRREINSYVLKFNTLESTEGKGVSMKIPEGTSIHMNVLNLRMKLSSNINSSLTVTLQTHDKKSDLFFLHYITSGILIEIKGQHIYYGLGTRRFADWHFFSRNLVVDLLKGIAASNHAKKLKKRLVKTKVRVLTLEFEGKGEVTNISLSTSEHLRHFFDAADWLVENQDQQGGWPIPVARKVISGLLEVSPGWYSAMAQGQAMSLLVRAAHVSGNNKYIESAASATKLFMVNVSQGGIRTHFPGGYVWYEEYPTSPSLFVLNGFMYSLLGLYDLKQDKSAPANHAEQLFENGMKSLETLLPLFDTGQGSLYDLRHFTSHIAPNLARWDYHTTHITQLLTLATVVDASASEFLKATSERWIKYLVGKRARHN